MTIAIILACGGVGIVTGFLISPLYRRALRTDGYARLWRLPPLLALYIGSFVACMWLADHETGDARRIAVVAWLASVVATTFWRVRSGPSSTAGE